LRYNIDIVKEHIHMAESTVIDKEKVVTVTDPKTDAAAREKLTTARIGLLLKAPFFGQLATRMTLTNADEWCGTAATDGRKFYYNSEFVNKMPLKQLEFLVGHEILHAVYDHMGRRGDRQPRLSNIAADYCVNQDLVEQRIGEKISVVPILFDAKFKGQSYEEVYDYLYENADKINLDQLEQMLLDDHLEEGDGSDGEGDGKDGNGRPKLSKEEAQAIRDEIKGAVIAAAQAAGAGNLPSGVKRLLKDLTAPVIGWKELLQQQITAVIKNDYTWARPSRRGWHMDAIMPGLKPGDMIDICIAMDQSGSISEADSKAFLSEIKGIMEAFDEYKITLWCFDTEIYNVKTYTSDNIEDIMNYEPMGGGGTDFMANWEFMKAENIEPKKFIMFTDGMPFGEWGEEEYCETVWIIKGNPGCEPPWGIWAHYEEAAKGAK
jgi:predicted metal-dependent peptidase